MFPLNILGIWVKIFFCPKSRPSRTIFPWDVTVSCCWWFIAGRWLQDTHLHSGCATRKIRTGQKREEEYHEPDGWVLLWEGSSSLFSRLSRMNLSLFSKERIHLSPVHVFSYLSTLISCWYRLYVGFWNQCVPSNEESASQLNDAYGILGERETLNGNFVWRATHTHTQVYIHSLLLMYLFHHWQRLSKTCRRLSLLRKIPLPLLTVALEALGHYSSYCWYVTWVRVREVDKWMQKFWRRRERNEKGKLKR